MEDKITIIMPVYNSEQYLKRSIESVLNQTYRNIELLCVDDFSLDDSLNILNEYQKIDNRIKIIEFKQNRGQGFARNEALKQSSGDYIMFLDSDDSFELNTCELVLNQIVKNNNEFVFFDYVKHFSNRKDVVGNILKPLLREENNPHINPTSLKVNMFNSFYAFSAIYKKSFLQENNISFANSKLCEDDIFYLKCWLYARDISIINLPLYNYFVRENSSSFETLDFKNILRAKKECLEECKKHYKDSCLIYNYVKYYIEILLFYMKKFSMLNRKIEKDFFHEIKEVFQDLDKEFNIALIKEDINWVIFNRIKNYSFFHYKTAMFFEKIFLRRRYGEAFILKIFNKVFKFPIHHNKRIFVYKTSFGRYLNINGLNFKIKRRTYKNIYINALRQKEALNEFLDYFKKTVPIDSLPPITGELREIQLRVLEFAKKLCSEFKKNDINSFLICGSAIGAVRHKGFIPWDDDIDIGMLRKDYVTLEDFCKKNFVEIDISDLKINYKFADGKYNILQNAFEKYSNQIFFMKSYNMLQIFCGTSLDNFASLDVFPFDYYRDDYSFDEHKKYLQELRFKVRNLKNHKASMQFLKKELDTNPNIVEKSNKIYSGIDSLLSYDTKANCFFDADKFFPLKKVLFEDTEFYAPASLDHYLMIHFGNYMAWPEYVKFSKHLKARNNFINKNKK